MQISVSQNNIYLKFQVLCGRFKAMLQELNGSHQFVFLCYLKHFFNSPDAVSFIPLMYLSGL